MENGYSLHNPEISGINYEVPALSVIQSRDEEEEAAEDEKRKAKEIHDILASTNMFDGLLDDDDFDELSVISEQKEESLVHHQSLERLNRENSWQDEGHNWSEPPTDRTSTRNENSFISNEINSNNYEPTGQKYDSPGSEDGNESSQYTSENIETSRNDPNHFVNNSQGDFENNEYSDLQQNQVNGYPQYFNNTKLKPYPSQNILESEENREQEVLVPQAVNKENQIYFLGSHNDTDNIEESQISNYLLNSTEVKNIDASQRQMLRAGMDNSVEMIQLRAICQARSNEISILQEQLRRVQDESEKETDLLKRNLQKMKAENESLKRLQKNTVEELDKYKTMNSQLQGKLASLEKIKKTLDEAKQKVENKLFEAESSIESLNIRLAELENSETLSKNRIQQEKAIASLKQRYSSEIQEFREKLDESRALNEDKDEELAKLRDEMNKHLKTSEEKLAEKLEIINRLTRSLEESQKQCQDLLKSRNVTEMTFLKPQAENVISSRAFGDNIMKSLQEENDTLKNELEMYEHIHHSLNLETPSHFNNTIAELNINKTLNWKTPSSEKSDGEIGIVTSLKRELERSLASNRAKRTKLSKLHAEHRLTLKERDLSNNNLSYKERELQSEKEKNAVLQEKLQQLDPHSKNSHYEKEIQKLTSENESLTTRLEQAYQHIEDLRNNETSLSNSVSHLHKQIAQLVQEHNEDRRQTLDRCQQTFLQHHEESIKKIRKELTDIHREEIQTLQEKLQGAYKQLDSVKESYIEVCHEKEEIEENLKVFESKFESNLKKNLQENETLWKKKVQNVEHDIEQKIKSAVEKAQTERDLKWQEQMKSVKEEKERELMQKLMEVNNKFELEKCHLMNEIEEKDAKNKEEELLKLKEKLVKQHELVIKRLNEKHFLEKQELVKASEDKLKHEQMMELKYIEEKHKAECEELSEKLDKCRLEEIKQFEEKKNEENRQSLQQLVLKKNKEKCDKMKLLKEQYELEKKELLQQMEAKKNEQIKTLEEIKNLEIEKLKELIEENELKYKRRLEFYDRMLRNEKLSEKPSDDLQGVREENEKKRENREEHKHKTKGRGVRNSFGKQNKTSPDTSSDSDTRIQSEELLKIQQLGNELEDALQKLRLKEREIHELRTSLSDKLLDENSELLIKFAEKKDKEKQIALKTLAEKKNKEFEDAFMKLIAQKDIELKEAMKSHQMCRCKKNMDEAFISKHDGDANTDLQNEKNYDDAYFRMLREQNAELFKMLKSTRDEYEKEKNELQQHYVKALHAWKNKHLQMVQAYQKAHSLPKQQNGQENSEEQIMSLKAEAGKLEAELKLHKCKIHELETTLKIKSSQLENFQRDHFNGLKQIEIKMQNFVDEMHTKLTEKDDKMREKDMIYQKLLHEIQARNDEKENSHSRDVQSNEGDGESIVSNHNELRENQLKRKVLDLQNGLIEAEQKLNSVKTSLEKDIEDLKLQLEKTIKERDAAIIALQNVLETDSKNKEEAFHTSLKYQAVLKEKLRRCYKQIQAQEQQHQAIADKLHQNYAETIKNLMKHLQEISQTNAVDFECKVKEINKEHENQVTELRQQYSQKLKSLQKHYSEELESLTKISQQYQQIQGPTNVNSNPKYILEIEENVKKIVFSLQKDVLQYLERLKLQVMETIEKEVKEDRIQIINKIKEKFEGIETVSPRSENIIQYIGDANPKSPVVKFTVDKIPINNLFKNWGGIPKAMSTGDVDNLVSSQFNICNSSVRPVKEKLNKPNGTIKIIRHSQSTNIQTVPVNGVPKGLSLNQEKFNHYNKSIKSKNSHKDKKGEGESSSRILTATNLHHSKTVHKSVQKLQENDKQATQTSLHNANSSDEILHVPNPSLVHTNKMPPDTNHVPHFVTTGLPREQPVGQSASETYPSSLNTDNNSANHLAKSSFLTMTAPVVHNNKKYNSTSENSNIRLPDLKESIIHPCVDSEEQINSVSKTFTSPYEPSYSKWQHQHYSSPDLLHEKLNELRDQASAHSFHPLETESDSSFSGEAGGTSDQNKITSPVQLKMQKNNESSNKNWEKQLPNVKMLN